MGRRRAFFVRVGACAWRALARARACSASVPVSCCASAGADTVPPFALDRGERADSRYTVGKRREVAMVPYWLVLTIALAICWVADQKDDPH